jgi:hypothetical protein
MRRQGRVDSTALRGACDASAYAVRAGCGGVFIMSLRVLIVAATAVAAAETGCIVEAAATALVVTQRGPTCAAAMWRVPTPARL